MCLVHVRVKKMQLLLYLIVQRCNYLFMGKYYPVFGHKQIAFVNRCHDGNFEHFRVDCWCR